VVAEKSAVFAEGLPLLPVVAFRNLKASLRVAEPWEGGGCGKAPLMVARCRLMRNFPATESVSEEFVSVAAGFGRRGVGTEYL
jgi:hypothetical protein